MKDQPFGRWDEGQLVRYFLPDSKLRFRCDLGERAEVVQSQSLRSEQVLRQPPLSPFVWMNVVIVE